MNDLITNEFNHSQLQLLKDTICKGATDDELSLFVNICKKTGLDPFTKQIFAVKRFNSKLRRDEMTAQTSVDGLRLIADRSGKYEGQTKVEWCGKDGVWKDIWIDEAFPYAARVGVWKTGFREALYAIAIFDSYVQYTKENEVNSFWKRFPELMIAKCAESLALRRAFPNEMSGIYSQEEMGQSENPVKVKYKDVVEVKAPQQIEHKPPTQSQLQLIKKVLIDQLSLTRDGAIEFIKQKVGKSATSELTFQEASIVIDEGLKTFHNMKSGSVKS